MKKRLMALIMTIAMCLSMLPVTALAEDPHMHTDGASFEKPISTLSQLQELFENGGSGYLVADIVNGESPLRIVGKDVDLCLCGYVIDLNAQGNIQLVKDEEKSKCATLNLYDCGTTEHTFDTSEAQWKLKAEGDTVIKGGIITNGTGGRDGGARGAGGAFNVDSECKITMHGGNLVGNSTTAGGGAVYINKDSEFKMLGGSIMGNVAQNTGGGVCINGGAMIMLGGRISNNTNTSNAQNRGGGIYTQTLSKTGGTVEFGGTAVVEGNLYKNGDASDVYNKDGKLSVAASPNAPKEGMRIGILKGEIENAVSGQEEYFFADRQNNSVKFLNDSNKIVFVHVHDEGTDEEIIFETSVSTIWELKELFENGGSGYLTADIVNDEALLLINGKNVDLCLCGYVIDLNAYGNIRLTKDGENCATLDLYDCGTTEHTFDTSEAQWKLDEDGDTVIKGGVITNGTGGIGSATSGAGGAFNIGAECKLTMHGGNLVGNVTTAGGGAVYINKGSEFKMLGGSIMGNVSNNTGGGICIEGGAMIMLGGRISNNTNTYSTENNGGGIYVKAFSGTGGTIEFGGTAVVEGNLYKNGDASDVYNLTGKLSIAESPNAPGDGMHIGISCIGLVNNKIENAVSGQEKYFFADSDRQYVAFNDNNTGDYTADDFLELCDIPGDNYKISVMPAENGAVSVVPYAEADTTVTLTVIPNEGCKFITGSLKATYYNGEEKELNLITDKKNTYTFTMPEYPVTVTAAFKVKETERSPMRNILDIIGGTYTADGALTGHTGFKETAALSEESFCVEALGKFPGAASDMAIKKLWNADGLSIWQIDDFAGGEPEYGERDDFYEDEKIAGILDSEVVVTEGPEMVDLASPSETFSIKVTIPTGSYYSEKLNAYFYDIDEDGKPQKMCYDGFEFTRGTSEPEEPEGHEHDYGTATYIWHDGLTQCTAYKTCACGNAVIETVDTVQSGTTITADFSEEFTDQTRTVETPEEPHEHSCGEWIDCGDGKQHKRVWSCGAVEYEPHNFNPLTHKCDACGAQDTYKADVKINVDVKANTIRQYFGFWPFGYYKNVTTYTYTIKTKATGVKVMKVQYQSDDGKWKTGTYICSNKPINTLKVKVWDNTGKMYEYTYIKNK